MDIIPPTYSRGNGAPAASATRIGPDTVVCATCGCRLTERGSSGVSGARGWYHYDGTAGRDARGCAVACAETAHRVD